MPTACRQPGRRVAGPATVAAAALLASTVVGSPQAAGQEIVLQLHPKVIWEGQRAVLEVRVVNPTEGLGDPQLPPTPKPQFSTTALALTGLPAVTSASPRRMLLALLVGPRRGRQTWRLPSYGLRCAR